MRSISCGDMTVNYRGSEEGVMSLSLVPAALVENTIAPRTDLGSTADAPFIKPFHSVTLRQPEPLVHVRRSGDVHADGQTPGTTLRYGATTSALTVNDFSVDESDGVDVACRLDDGQGLQVTHHMRWRPGWKALLLWTTVENRATDAVHLELVTSFSLGGLSPFAADDAPGALYVHRLRAAWSSEGRHERRLAEELDLERAWAPFALRNLRYGQVGTKPVLGFAPWVGIEDARSGVLWAAHLEAPGSWQCEIGRRDDGISMTGGMADRELGHWSKCLEPGARMITPAAWLTVCQGDIDDACNRLLHQQGPSNPARIDRDLPVMFNEWCTTWGNPSEQNLLAIADCLKDTPCRYLVIDAGWYKSENGSWTTGQGDWHPSAALFPDGLKAVCAAIRERGLVPGLWFEFEVAGTESALFHEDDSRFLQLDGTPIQAGERRFLDMRQERNHDLLEQRVIKRIEESGIGYIKVDYNASAGIGCDGAESLGEALRQHVGGVQRFFRRLRERCPEVVIENCSSGGQRLEPSFNALADMNSFSDAHTCRDIPVVAGNTARLNHPRQNQVWAVLMPDDDERRLVYSLAATFLGRMCLSGEIWHLGGDAMALVRYAMELYGRCAPVIENGTSRRCGNWSPSSRHLTGWHAVVRHGADGACLVVVHVFGDGAQPLPLPVGANRTVAGQLTEHGVAARVEANCLRFSRMPAWSAAVVLLS